MKFFKKAEEPEQDRSMEDLRRRIGEVHLPAAVEKIALQELDLLARIGPASADFSIGLAYVDYLLSLPWNRKTEDNLDIRRAEQILNENHFGLDRIKDRV